MGRKINEVKKPLIWRPCSYLQKVPGQLAGGLGDPKVKGRGSQGPIPLPPSRHPPGSMAEQLVLVLLGAPLWLGQSSWKI